MKITIEVTSCADCPYIIRGSVMGPDTCKKDYNLSTCTNIQNHTIHKSCPFRKKGEK